MKQYRLQDPVYGRKLNLFTGGTFKEYQEIVEHYTGEKQPHYYDETEGIYSYFPEKDLYFMWVKDNKNIPLIGHEVMHLVFGMLDSKGIKYCAESEEAFTYSLQYWLRIILDKLKK